jgi:hypothetical protein
MLRARRPRPKATKIPSVRSTSGPHLPPKQDLKKKPKLREKYGILDEWVMPFEVIPIIEIPGYGDKAAQVGGRCGFGRRGGAVGLLLV